MPPAGYLSQRTLKPGAAVRSAQGVSAINKTGASIPRGSLVALAKTDAATKIPTMVLANAGTSGGRARYITTGAVGDGNTAIVVRAVRLTGLDTSSGVLDAAVYEAAVAGGWSATDPSVGLPARRRHIVGYFDVISATDGVISFDMGDHADAPGEVDGFTSQLRLAFVTLTNAEVLNLRATAKELVPAPGAGFINEFVSIVLAFDYTAAYTIVGAGDDLAVRYVDGTGVICSETIESTGFVDATADTMTTGRPKVDIIAAKTSCDNKALVLDNIGAAEFGAGNAANVIRARVSYRIIPAGW